MKNRILLLLLIAGASLVTACASQSRKGEQHIGFSEVAAKSISSTRVVIGIDNSLERHQTQPHYAGGTQFGLLGAVIETAIAASFESERQQKAKAVSSVRAAAIKFNFLGAFKSELERTLKAMSWLNVSYIYADVGPQSRSTERLLSEAKEDAVMVADVAYAFAPNMDRLVVTAYVDVHPKKPDLAKLAYVSEGTPLLFRKGFDLEYPLEGEYIDEAQASAAWSRNDGEMLHRALRRAVTDLVAQIGYELSLRPSQT